MKARIVRIGNSRGIRIPKPLLEQSRLGSDVEITVEDNRLVIGPARRPRAGWDDAFAAMAKRKEDRLLDLDIPTKWDETEWEW